jgi:hypothetical protein
MTAEEAMQLKPGQVHGTKPCLLHGLDSPGIITRITVFAAGSGPQVETFCKHCYTENNLVIAFNVGFAQVREILSRILAIPEARAALQARLLNRVQQEDTDGS